MASTAGLEPAREITIGFESILSDVMSGYVSTYLWYNSSLSFCHVVLPILSKGVYEHPSVRVVYDGPLMLAAVDRSSLTTVDV